MNDHQPESGNPLRTLRQLTVEKIGGTSMSALDKVLDNIIFYPHHAPVLTGRVFVVSAFSGVTDLLLENKKTGAPGVYHQLKNYRDFRRPLQKLLHELQRLNKGFEHLGLQLKTANEFIEERICKAKKYLGNLASVLSSGYVEKEGILRAAREILASVGEAHAAFNLTNVLQHRGLRVQLADLSGFDDHRSFTIDQRIKNVFSKVDLHSGLCVATGYVKGTEGIMREFDRGYSEVTFSKIATILRPQEAIIHKEYHLSTADPVLVGPENCLPVGATNYDIADQLAVIGMEAIHPRAAKPLEMAGIDLRIKNTFQPGHPGTLISRHHVPAEKKIDLITGTDKLVLVNIADGRMVGSLSPELCATRLLEEAGIPCVFKAMSANSLTIVVWEKHLHKKIISQLQEGFERVTSEPVAMVCVLGANMDRPGLLARSAAALTAAGVNLKCAAFPLGAVNIQFILAREAYARAIAALNQMALYDLKDEKEQVS